MQQGHSRLRQCCSEGLAASHGDLRAVAPSMVALAVLSSSIHCRLARVGDGSASSGPAQRANRREGLRRRRATPLCIGNTGRSSPESPTAMCEPVLRNN